MLIDQYQKFSTRTSERSVEDSAVLLKRPNANSKNEPLGKVLEVKKQPNCNIEEYVNGE